MTNYFTAEPMKYFSFPSTYSKERRQERIQDMINGGQYIYSLKTDGNLLRAVVTPDASALQTRGVSKVTGTYSDVKDKVFWWKSIEDAFEDTTVLIGEAYLPNGIDADVASGLRSLTPKAKSIQSKEYYLEEQQHTHFTPKDKRDIENNKFFNIKIHYRIFDVICYNGVALENEPISTRIPYIKKAVEMINNPLVSAVEYYDMNDTFYDRLSQIFSAGGEGVVCYKKDAVYYEFGKRGPHSFETLKIKQEIENEIDCFIYDVLPPTKEYNGKYLSTWQYWLNEKTYEKLYGNYYDIYANGRQILTPITKDFYNNYPSAIRCGVYDKDKNIIPLCDCSGITEQLKENLRDNLEQYKMCPVKIGGMTISKRGGNISIRHPRFIALRYEDISTEDCQLAKIIDEGE